YFFVCLSVPAPPRPTLFPYTTLFRSGRPAVPAAGGEEGEPGLLRATEHLELGPGLVAHPREHLVGVVRVAHRGGGERQQFLDARSEEHTSELQSRENLVCRLLLEKKK